MGLWACGVNWWGGQKGEGEGSWGGAVPGFEGAGWLEVFEFQEDSAGVLVSGRLALRRYGWGFKPSCGFGESGGFDQGGGYPGFFEVGGLHGSGLSAMGESDRDVKERRRGKGRK